MVGFIEYLASSVKLYESSIINIDFTRGEEYAKELLLKSNL